MRSKGVLGLLQAKILILGSYHFASSGRHMVEHRIADVLNPQKQAEILEVVDALARFQPTKVAVEKAPSLDAELQGLYTAYRAGMYVLGRSETQQLGFCLAARFNHPRLYPINQWDRGMPFHQALEEAKEQDPAFALWFEEWAAEQEAEGNRLQETKTVRQLLRHHNDPSHIAKDHALYLAFAPIGAGGSYVGAELISAWYDRNIRIFANLYRLIKPSDRILVIYGAGHAAILRELVRGAENMKFVDPLDFL